MKIICPILLIVLKLQLGQTLVTYQSTLPISAIAPISGLSLLKESIKRDTNFTNGITICIRFNYRKLGKRMAIFTHQKQGTEDWKYFYVRTEAGYDQGTFFHFGGLNWIVKDMVKNSFILWSTNRWHSVCVSFDHYTSHIRFVKVLSHFKYQK